MRRFGRENRSPTSTMVDALEKLQTRTHTTVLKRLVDHVPLAGYTARVASGGSGVQLLALERLTSI